MYCKYFATVGWILGKVHTHLILKTERNSFMADIHCFCPTKSFADDRDFFVDYFQDKFNWDI